jgi:hypothetical protein
MRSDGRKWSVAAMLTIILDVSAPLVSEPAHNLGVPGIGGL